MSTSPEAPESASLGAAGSAPLGADRETANPSSPAAALTADELQRRVAPLRAKRGYLLPHHGLLAATSGQLLQAYDQAYTALALEMKTLSVRDRELVWLAVLIATDEALASHHIPKFFGGGGTPAEFDAVVRLTALVQGSGAFRFVDRHWARHVPAFDAAASYRAAVVAVAAPLSPRDVWLCACAVHAARGDFDDEGGLRDALIAAYDAGVAEPDLAEALSIMMFPGSVPYYVEAARVWLELIRAGRVQPSPAFAAWAALEGQGGHAEASRAQPSGNGADPRP